MLTIELEPDTQQLLDAIAQKEHRSPNEIIKQLINTWRIQLITSIGSPYKSMQVEFYQRVTGIGITNKNLQVNAS